MTAAQKATKLIQEMERATGRPVSAVVVSGKEIRLEFEPKEKANINAADLAPF